MILVCQLLLPAIIALQQAILGQGVSAQLSRQRFPSIRPGGIGGAASVIRRLLGRGLTPETVTGPFGSLTIGTADQDLPLLAAEAALRRLNSEVLAELLAEDPLLFIRNLPFGDPRRVAVGLDPPGIASLPSTTAPPGPGGNLDSLRLLEGRPTTTVQAATAAGRGAFFTRNLRGFAVR